MTPADRFIPPSAREPLARLDASMEAAMRTQRAVRRLHLDPVPLAQDDWSGEQPSWVAPVATRGEATA